MNRQRQVAAVVAVVALIVWGYLMPKAMNYTETRGEQLVRTLAFLTVAIAGFIAARRE